MKILLLNDNPVVRKLVALSAQKTKDELSVIAFPDEVEDNEYDLLIIDDGKYSDEMFSSLQEALRYKSSLLMATRGNAVPAGFDNVINKPFLPTDLVDLFIQIEKHLPSESVTSSEEESRSLDVEKPVDFDTYEDEALIQEAGNEINLDEDISDFHGFNELSIAEEADDLAIDMGTAILDEDEVNEVRGLLEDAELDFESATADEENILNSGSLDDLLNEENDLLEDFAESSSLDEEEMELPADFSLDEDISAEETASSISDDAFEMSDLENDILGSSEELEDDLALLDEIGTKSLEEDLPLAVSDVMEDDDFDLGELELGDDILKEETNLDAAPLLEVSEEEINDDLKLDEFDLANEMIQEEEEESLQAPSEILDEELELPQESTSDELDAENFGTLDLEDSASLEDDLTPMSEDEFEELEEQIRNAVEDLDEESLGMEIDELEIPSMNTTEDDSDDPFAGLDERTIKMAVGEEVEELPEEEEEPEEEEIIEEETAPEEDIEEAEELSMELEENVPVQEKEIGLTLPNDAKSTSEGVEAIQALIRTLADEEVAKSLKGLNINININFGNNK